MNIAVMSLAILGAFIVLAIVAVSMTGRRQPSQRIYRHATILFVAARRRDPDTRFVADGALWTSRTLFPLIGTEDAHWTDFAILPPDASAVSRLSTRSGLSDLFVTEVELTAVPAFALGVLRLQHRLGLTRRPTGPVPTAVDHIDGRRELLPTSQSIARAQAHVPRTPVTMVNFLEYYALARGDTKDGRDAYLRYGREAFKAVHAVGGQFLFAGRITAVLVQPQDPDWQREWDDLAAMIYPDPTAIFAMEQFPFYRRALGERDDGLKRTCVIATRAY